MYCEQDEDLHGGAWSGEGAALVGEIEMGLWERGGREGSGRSLEGED